MAFRAPPLLEKRGGGDRKNICNPEIHRRRTVRPSAAARGSAKCETVVDQPLRLRVRANSIARAKQPTRDHIKPLPRKCARLHQDRAHDRSRPARVRADTIAGTTPFDFANSTPFPNPRPSAPNIPCRCPHIRPYAQEALV